MSTETEDRYPITDASTLVCDTCGKATSGLEARTRIFATGCCGYCGLDGVRGVLLPVLPKDMLLHRNRWRKYR